MALMAKTSDVRNTNTVPMPTSIKVNPWSIRPWSTVFTTRETDADYTCSTRGFTTGYDVGMLRSTLLFVLACASAVVLAEETVDIEALEKSGAVVGRVFVDNRNVFDLSDPEESSRLYRWANRLHVVTRDDTIRQQILFEPGDVFSKRLLDETARILRSNRYLYDADVRPVSVSEGKVDVEVSTRDVWSLVPEIELSRSGGENRTAFGLEESNLLGRGQLLRAKHVSNVDRDSSQLDFEDRQLGNSWVALFLRLSDNSDGHSNYLSVTRPFHELDARWSAGTFLFDDQRRTALYSLGEEAVEFLHEREYVTASGGWSRGLRNGWVRRWNAGFVYDDNRFSSVPEPELPPGLVPPDRKLVYPFLSVEILEDSYETSSNTNNIGRTEDFLMGTRLAASIGWASEGVGADRDAVIYTASIGQGYGSLQDKALFLSASARGRNESGRSANVISSFDTRYYSRQSDKRLFFVTLSGSAGHNLDLDTPVQLGGKTGLRGYPLRYQSGDSKLLLTIEQRYFTDWYPFHLFRVGGAVFVDVGRTWGDNPVGERNYGWLKDVGFGLRFAPTRFSTQKIAHLDFAFPLDGDPSIDEVQILLTTKRSF